MDSGAPPPGELWGDNMDDDVDVDVLAEAFFEAGGGDEEDDGLGFHADDDENEFLNETLGENSATATTGRLENAMTKSFLQQQMTSPSVVSQSPTSEDTPQEGVNPTPSEFLPAQAVQPTAIQPTVAAASPQAQLWPASFMTMARGMAPGLSTGSMLMGDPQQQGFIYAAPNPLMNAEGMGQQPHQVTILPNPFLAMAAGMPMLDRAQFIEAAFAARAKNRRRNTAATQEQAEKRRERNRVLAKKTRDRKKNHMTDLQDELLELQRANAELKAMVRNNIDEKDSAPILDQCNAIDKVPENVWEACGTDKKELAADDYDLVTSIQKSQTAFVITDPSFEDNPIVFVSPDFLALTGYAREQVIGRNCRFLQGTATDPDKVDQIRHALAAGEDVGVTLINYKADGTPFWNRLFIAAVRDVNDNIVNYMSVSVQVSRPEPGDPEHEKELPE
ncbi:hypothetical protein ACA910_000385 [Epithemia clementina (nom. ined.)]